MLVLFNCFTIEHLCASHILINLYTLIQSSEQVYGIHAVFLPILDIGELRDGIFCFYEISEMSVLGFKLTPTYV